MITHTLTNAQLGKPYQLLNYIDNRDNEKTIGLKSITYWVGWYNVTGKQYIATKNKRTDLEPGLYNFNDLDRYFLSNQGINLSVNKTNGSVTLEIPTNTELQLSAGILSLLGISKQRLTGKHHGKIDLAKPKGLYIYLNKINTTTNYVDGAPSTLLAIINPVTDKPFGKKCCSPI